MEWNDLLADGYGRITDTVEGILKNLTKEDLDWQPRSDCNSIGWTIWHLARVQDAQVADLMKKEQLWIKDKWYARFKRKEDPEDTGFGHTPDDVSAFKSPSSPVLLDYLKATVEQSKSFFPSLPKTDLDKELNEPWFKPLPTVGVRLISILADGLLHAGEAAYLRGLRQGKGWQKY
jgi:hypothetical protein